MTPERWEQVGQLYQAALELEPERRLAFLQQALVQINYCAVKWSPYSPPTVCWGIIKYSHCSAQVGWVKST